MRIRLLIIHQLSSTSLNSESAGLAGLPTAKKSSLKMCNQHNLTQCRIEQLIY